MRGKITIFTIVLGIVPWIGVETTLAFENARSQPGQTAIPEITASVPENGSIDARAPLDAGRGKLTNESIRVTLRFEPALRAARPGDFLISGSDDNLPTVIAADISENLVSLLLDRPLPLGKWTTVTHAASQASVRLGRLPGDVNGDGSAGPMDVLAMIDALNGLQSRGNISTDIDRSGIVDDDDLALLRTLLNGSISHAGWAGRRLEGTDTPTPTPAGLPIVEYELVPVSPGPYPPCQKIGVDLLVRRTMAGDPIDIRGIQFDVSNSSPELLNELLIELPPTHSGSFFFWDFSSTVACQTFEPACGAGYEEFYLDQTPPPINEAAAIVWTVKNPIPDALLTIPGDTSSLLLGRMFVTTPQTPGSYTLDVINVNALDINNGAYLAFDFDTPMNYWSADGTFGGAPLPVDVANVPAPPTADAGDDVDADDDDGDCLASVMLTGSANDCDGIIESYSWRIDNVEIATGPAPTVDLLVGVHNIDLVVTDNDGLTGEDSVQVTVSGIPETASPAIVSSVPPDGYIDPRDPVGGIQQVQVEFSTCFTNTDGTALSADAFSVSTISNTAGAPIEVTSIDASGYPVVVLNLSEPIVLQGWTVITASLADTMGNAGSVDLDLGFLPGDVTQSSNVNISDVTEFRAVFFSSQDPLLIDTNRSGNVNVSDATDFRFLFENWSGQELPPRP